MKKQIILMAIMITTIASAQLDPTDPNNQSTNSTQNTGDYKPQPIEHGAIVIEDMSVSQINWFNLYNNYFTVYWKLNLTDAEWTPVAEAYKAYEHNYPEGFYMVLPIDNLVAIPVSNSGTSDLNWTGFIKPDDGGDTWLRVYDMVNTNIPPEKCTGLFVVEKYAEPPEGINQGYFRLHSVDWDGTNKYRVKEGTIAWGDE